MAPSILVNAETAKNPWMVMVHGMSQDHRVFARQVDAFKSRYRILLVDLPGHGLASAIAGPFGHLEFADHVHRTIVSEGIDDACYWGTHTGATIGLLLAARRKGRLRCLILEAPAVPGDNPPIVVQAIEKAQKTACRDGVDAAVAEWWAESCWFEYMRANPEACRADEHLAIVRDFGGTPWTDDASPQPVANIEMILAAVALPTLIYNGAGDHPDFLSAANRVKNLLPNAETRLVEYSGGFPAWENPDAVTALVSSFLAAQRTC